MYISDQQPHGYDAVRQQQVDATIECVLTPEIQSAPKVQSARVSQERVAQNSGVQESELQANTGFDFIPTDVLTPEILKQGGLEAALLLLIQEKGMMFESTLKSRINDSKSGQERLSEKTQERIEKMREAIQEMDKSKKLGEVSMAFGWVGIAASGIAIALTAGAASPLFLAASVGMFGVSTALQIDAASGGHMIRAVGDEKTQMAVSIALGVVMTVASFGLASVAAAGGVGRNAVQTSKLGRFFGGGKGAAASNAGNKLSGHGVHNSIGKNYVGVDGPKRLQDMTRQFDNGDHWAQKGSQAVASGSEIASSVTSIRASYSNWKASGFSATSVEMRAIEKRLSTYMDFIGQVIQDILGQIQGGNRTLAKQLQLAFDPKKAILSHV